MTQQAAQRVIEILTARLQNGLTHPGNPNTGQPAKVILLPGMKSTGIPAEMAAQFAQEAGLPANDAPQVIAEAIVHLITNEAGLELTERTELDQLRAQLATPDPNQGAQVTIHCRCNPAQPLLIVTSNRAAIHTDGQALRQRLDQVCTCT